MVASKKNKPPKKGRPTIYTQSVADEICTRLSEGESLNKICMDPHMPGKAIVYIWLSDGKHKPFLDKYMCARELQADTFIDECLDIADASAIDTLVKTSKNGEEYEVPNHEWIARSKLRVDTRMKMAEKMAPRKYAPQAKHEITGKDGAPLVIQVSRKKAGKIQDDVV